MSQEPSPGHGMLTMLADGLSSSVSPVDASAEATSTASFESLPGNGSHPSLVLDPDTSHAASPAVLEGQDRNAGDLFESLHQYQSMNSTPLPASMSTSALPSAERAASTASPFVTRQASRGLESNVNDHTNEYSEFEIQEAEDDDETQVRTVMKRQAPREHARSRRRSNRLKRTKSESSVSLEDLLSDRFIHLGQILVFYDQEGVVTKDGWIEYGIQRLPDVGSFCRKVYSDLGIHKKALLGDLGDVWDEILVKPPATNSESIDDSWGFITLASLRDVYLSENTGFSPRKKRRTMDASSNPGGERKIEETDTNAWQQTASDAMESDEDQDINEGRSPIRTRAIETPRKKAFVSPSLSSPLSSQKKNPLIGCDVVHSPDEPLSSAWKSAQAVKAAGALFQPAYGHRQSELTGKSPLTARLQNRHREVSREIPKAIDGVTSVSRSNSDERRLMRQRSLEEVMEKDEKTKRRSGEEISRDRSMTAFVNIDEPNDETQVDEKALSKRHTKLSRSISQHQMPPPPTQRNERAQPPSFTQEERGLEDLAKDLGVLETSSQPFVAPTTTVGGHGLATSPNVMSLPSNSSSEISLPFAEQGEKSPDRHVSKGQVKEKVQDTAVICTSGLDSKQLTHLLVLNSKLKVRNVSDITDEVSHLVVNVKSDETTSRTVKYLLALLKGKKIVSFKWVLSCVAESKVVDVTPFLVKGDSFAFGAQRKAAKDVSENGSSSLFSKYSFYFAPGPYRVPAPDLQSLKQIAVAGGVKQVLSEAPPPPGTMQELYDSEVVVIGDPKCEPEVAKKLFLATGRRMVEYKWLLDSVSRYKPRDISDYIIAITDPAFVVQTQQSLEF